MKKFIAMLLILVSSAAANAQQYSIKDFSKWSIGANWQMIHPSTVISTRFKPSNYDYGVSLKYTLSHALAVETRFSTGDFHVSNSAYDYDTHLNSVVSVNGIASIGNLNFIKNYRSWKAYAIGGVGKINYTSSDTISGSSVAFAQMGLGLTYRLGNKTSISAEYLVMSASGNKLIKEPRDYTGTDYLTKIGIGVTYNLGSKKHLDWHNPFEDVSRTLAAIDAGEIGGGKNDTIKLIISGPSSPKFDSLTVAARGTSVSVKALNQVYIGSVFFNYDTYEIDPTFESTILNAKKVLDLNQNLKLKLIGYTDANGSADYNQELALKRANEVCEYVKGIISMPKDRFIVTSNGESKDTFDDAINRRVDIYISVDDASAKKQPTNLDQLFKD